METWRPWLVTIALDGMMCIILLIIRSFYLWIIGKKRESVRPFWSEPLSLCLDYHSRMPHLAFSAIIAVNFIVLVVWSFLAGVAWNDSIDIPMLGSE